MSRNDSETSLTSPCNRHSYDVDCLSENRVKSHDNLNFVEYSLVDSDEVDVNFKNSRLFESINSKLFCTENSSSLLEDDNSAITSTTTATTTTTISSSTRSMPCAVSFRTGISIANYKRVIADTKHSSNINKGLSTLSDRTKEDVRCSRTTRSISWTIGLILSPLLLVSISVILVSTIKVNSQTSTNTNSTTSSNTTTTTTPTNGHNVFKGPFSSTLKSQLEIDLWNEIATTVDAELILLNHSAQRKAWDFVLTELRWEQEQTSNQTTSYQLTLFAQQRVQQRFSIATLFYLRQDQDWFEPSYGNLSFFEPLAKQHECDWKLNANGIESGVLNCANGKISEIKLFDQSIRGPIPKEIIGLPSLRYLNVSHNSLTGVLPQFMSQLSLLEVVDLSVNMLTGPLLESMADLGKLTKIVLDSNRFTGTLPSRWDGPQLPALTMLRLSHNQLNGSLQPNSWGNFPVLDTLDLSFNAFTGTTPAGLASASNLQSLLLNNNYFNGSREVVCSPTLTKLEVLLVDCVLSIFRVGYSTLLPEFDCPCCSICCSDEQGCSPKVSHVSM